MFAKLVNNNHIKEVLKTCYLKCHYLNGFLVLSKT